MFVAEYKQAVIISQTFFNKNFFMVAKNEIMLMQQKYLWKGRQDGVFCPF